MNRKVYKTPTMTVVMLQDEYDILAGSNGQASVQNYTKEAYDEWGDEPAGSRKTTTEWDDWNE